MPNVTPIEKKNLSTQQLADYIHQAAEIEKDIFKMKEAENSLKELASAKKENDIKEIPEFEPLPRDYSYSDTIFNEEITKDKFDRTYYSPGLGCFTYIGICIAIYAIILIISNIPGLLETVIGPMILNFLFAALIIVMISYLPIRLVINQKNREKAYKAFRQKEIDKCEENKKSLEKKEKDYWNRNDVHRQHYNNSCAPIRNHNKKVLLTVDAINNQAKIISEKRKEIEKVREDFYSLGIIPPDYRTMDCVYVLDHIFRNDLASDVRNAILLYKEWEFRGDVIRGMGAIISRLANLGNQMDYLTRDINDIRNNVNFMSQDLSRMAETQIAQNKSINKALENSQATRYATEAVQRHIEETKKYYDIQ